MSAWGRGDKHNSKYAPGRDISCEIPGNKEMRSLNSISSVFFICRLNSLPFLKKCIFISIPHCVSCSVNMRQLLLPGSSWKGSEQETAERVHAPHVTE